jgi:Na+/H+-dicarboxylate symporter
MTQQSPMETSRPASSNPDGKKLTVQILIGMGVGLAVGIALNLLQHVVPESSYGVLMSLLPDGLFHVVGQAFVRLLQVIVIPLVFVSLACGTASLTDLSQLGRLATKTLGLYLLTTAVAITVAMGAALLLRPGANFTIAVEGDFEGATAPSLVDTLIAIFPRNIIESMASGEMLPLIVFAILVGLAMSLAGEAGKRLLGFFQDLDAVVMKLVWVVMAIAPYGVFALIARTFAREGFEAFKPLLGYFFVVLGVLIFQALVTYPALLKLLSGLNPITFIRKMRETQLFAFSTASSNATLPITLETAEHRLGVKNSVASFTVPLGATINMDGTAIMQGVATVFLAQVYTIDLTIVDLMMVVLTATLASIGTAGVPGVGLIMLSMVLTQAGIPVAGIALIIGVDRLLDMARTAVNVTGDAVVTCIVAKSEGALETEVFDNPEN